MFRWSGSSKELKTPRKALLRRKGVWLVTAGLLLSCSAGLYILFSSGPVRMPFLGSLIASQGTRGPVTLAVDAARVDFTAPGGIQISLENADLEIAGPAPVSISLPQLLVQLDRDALFSGKIRFTTLVLDQPHVQVTLKGGPAKVPKIGPLLEAVDRTSDVVDDQFARRGLKYVSIRNGSFELKGVMPRRFPGINANILRSDNRVIRASARVAGSVSSWRLQLVRSAPEGGVQRKIGVVVNGITLAELLGPDALKKQGKGLGLPASAKVEAKLDGEGHFISANAVARVRDGWFQLGRTIVAFDDAALSVLFRAGQDAIEITRSHFIRGKSRIFFTGRVARDPEEDGHWRISLDSEFPQFGSADIPEPPQMLDGVKVEARFDPVERLLSVDRFVMKAGKAVAQGVASLQISPDGPYLALAAEGENIPVALAKQVWPITLVPPARRWIIDNIKAGFINKVSYTGAIRPPAFNHRDPDSGWSGNDMRLDMSFEGGAVTPFGNLPEVKNLKGTLTVKDEILTVAARNGVATASTGGEVKVPEGVFEIYHLPLRDGKTAKVSARINGTANELAAVADSDPLDVLERAGLQRGGATGSGSMDVTVEFPMAPGLSVEDIDWSVAGELNGFTDSNPIMGHTIEKADVKISANPDQVAITGKGILDGLQADIDLIEPLGNSGVVGKQDVVVSVTADQLKEKGIDLTAFVKGPLVLSVSGDGGDGQQFSVDMKQSELRLEALGWLKAKGVPAKASFKLKETGEGQMVRDFRLTSEGTEVSGSMQLSKSGELVEASFGTFRLRAGDDAEVELQRTGSGRYDIVFTGSSFDGRGLIQSLRSPGGSKGEGDFSDGARIAADIDRVTGFNNQTIQGFSGRIETGSKGLRTADVSGQVNGRSRFEFKVTEEGDSQLASGRFADTGATLKFLDLYERMEGGSGVLSVAMADEDSWAGDFKVRSLRITEDPAIQRIRQREKDNINPDSRIQSARSSDGSASFDTMDINFSREGDVLTIIRGALQGNVLGGTVSGTVDLNSQTLALSGTFVPIYALNNFFTKIPLLGFALGGNTGEGLIGVTYRLSGAVSDPVLTVNPISAIAPGIFRRMFEFQPNRKNRG